MVWGGLTATCVRDSSLAALAARKTIAECGRRRAAARLVGRRGQEGSGRCGNGRGGALCPATIRAGVHAREARGAEGAALDDGAPPADQSKGWPTFRRRASWGQACFVLPSRGGCFEGDNDARRRSAASRGEAGRVSARAATCRLCFVDTRSPQMQVSLRRRWTPAAHDDAAGDRPHPFSRPLNWTGARFIWGQPGPGRDVSRQR